MSSGNLSRQVEELGPWFHNLHLPDGTETAPDHFLGDFPRFKWDEIARHIPMNLEGWKVLDIGCNAGYYSFELAKRGAQVTGVDVDEHYLSQARWAAKVLEMEDKVEFRRAAVYELAYEDIQYDLVWFMGVLYHLRYPLLALDIVRKRCRGQMIFQTMTVPGDDVFPAAENYDLEQRQVLNNPGWPKMAFIEHKVAGDPTNWWAPNHAGIEAMLRAANFADIDCIGHEIYSCKASPVSTFGTEELYTALPISHHPRQ
jgi:tRNA (mo5U34)-methyltransferase